MVAIRLGRGHRDILRENIFVFILSVFEMFVYITRRYMMWMNNSGEIV